MLYNDSATMTTERAERHKDTSDQQLNKNVKNHQSLLQQIGGLTFKTCATVISPAIN